ncbi:ribosomal protein S18-alanine N-acetyltransferase [Georgenia sp. Z1344]|uniref:ribosomal protein S18-alanine N-acetyltransferase n=1 Tax=Georgenia sp. Z1344 TaxID=3416706 RepID=UPI003CE8C933
MSYRLRPLRPSDVRRVAELEPVLFGPDDWSASVYRTELELVGRTYLAVVDEEDRLVGWAGTAAGEEVQVMTIGIDPDHRRRGLATRLMDELVDRARRDGSRSMLLEVRADDPGARALYARRGFEEIGIRPRYYQRSGRDAVVMRLDLTAPEDAGNTEKE